MLMEANRWMFVKCSTDVVTSGIFLKDEQTLVQVVTSALREFVRDLSQCYRVRQYLPTLKK